MSGVEPGAAPVLSSFLGCCYTSLHLLVTSSYFSPKRVGCSCYTSGSLRSEMGAVSTKLYVSRFIYKPVVIVHARASKIWLIAARLWVII